VMDVNGDSAIYVDHATGTDRQHSSHCDHVLCTFSVALDQGNLASWLPTPWIVWERAQVDLSLGPTQKHGVGDSSQLRLPPGFDNRAVCQVWLI
jgi:hypothetical protein